MKMTPYLRHSKILRGGGTGFPYVHSGATLFLKKMVYFDVFQAEYGWLCGAGVDAGFVGSPDHVRYTTGRGTQKQVN